MAKFKLLCITLLQFDYVFYFVYNVSKEKKNVGKKVFFKIRYKFAKQYHVLITNQLINVADPTVFQLKR